MSAGQQALGSLGVSTGETPEQRLARENREAIERQAHSQAAAAAAHDAEEAKLPDARIAMSLGSVEAFAGGVSQNAPVVEVSSVPQPPPPPPGSAPLPTQPSAALAEIIQHGPPSISAESLTPSMAEQSQHLATLRTHVENALRQFPTQDLTPQVVAAMRKVFHTQDPPPADSVISSAARDLIETARQNVRSTALTDAFGQELTRLTASVGPPALLALPSNHPRLNEALAHAIGRPLIAAPAHATALAPGPTIEQAPRAPPVIGQQQAAAPGASLPMDLAIGENGVARPQDPTQPVVAYSNPFNPDPNASIINGNLRHPRVALSSPPVSQPIVTHSASTDAKQAAIARSLSLGIEYSNARQQGQLMDSAKSPTVYDLTEIAPRPPQQAHSAPPQPTARAPTPADVALPPGFAGNLGRSFHVPAQPRSNAPLPFASSARIEDSPSTSSASSSSASERSAPRAYGMTRPRDFVGDVRAIIPPPPSTRPQRPHSDRETPSYGDNFGYERDAEMPQRNGNGSSGPPPPPPPGGSSAGGNGLIQDRRPLGAPGGAPTPPSGGNGGSSENYRGHQVINNYYGSDSSSGKNLHLHFDAFFKGVEAPEAFLKRFHSYMQIQRVPLRDWPQTLFYYVEDELGKSAIENKLMGEITPEMSDYDVFTVHAAAFIAQYRLPDIVRDANRARFVRMEMQVDEDIDAFNERFQRAASLTYAHTPSDSELVPIYIAALPQDLQRIAYQPQLYGDRNLLFIMEIVKSSLVLRDPVQKEVSIRTGLAKESSRAHQDKQAAAFDSNPAREAARLLASGLKFQTQSAVRALKLASVDPFITPAIRDETRRQYAAGSGALTFLSASAFGPRVQQQQQPHRQPQKPQSNQPPPDKPQQQKLQKGHKGSQARGSAMSDDALHQQNLARQYGNSPATSSNAVPANAKNESRRQQQKQREESRDSNDTSSGKHKGARGMHVINAGEKNPWNEKIRPERKTPGTCTDCGQNHIWDHCGRNTESPWYTPQAGSYAGTGPYTPPSRTQQGGSSSSMDDSKKAFMIRSQAAAPSSSSRWEYSTSLVIYEQLFGPEIVLFDTGADENFMSKSAYESLGANRGELRKYKDVAYSASNHPMDVLGWATFPVRVFDEARGCSYTVFADIVIVPDMSYAVVLGRDFLTETVAALRPGGQIAFRAGMKPDPDIVAFQSPKSTMRFEPSEPDAAPSASPGLHPAHMPVDMQAPRPAPAAAAAASSTSSGIKPPLSGKPIKIDLPASALHNGIPLASRGGNRKRFPKQIMIVGEHVLIGPQRAHRVKALWRGVGTSGKDSVSRRFTFEPVDLFNEHGVLMPLTYESEVVTTSADIPDFGFASFLVTNTSHRPITLAKGRPIGTVVVDEFDADTADLSEQDAQVNYLRLERTINGINTKTRASIVSVPSPQLPPKPPPTLSAIRSQWNSQHATRSRLATVSVDRYDPRMILPVWLANRAAGLAAGASSSPVSNPTDAELVKWQLDKDLADAKYRDDAHVTTVGRLEASYVDLDTGVTVDLNKRLPTEFWEPIMKVLDSHRTLFTKPTSDKPPIAHDVQHHIRLTPGDPIKQRPYRLSPKHQRYVDEQVSKGVASGLYEPSNSPWASPVLVVPKGELKDQLRMCIDYRHLNRRVVKDAYPIPHIGDCLSALKHGGLMSIIDLENAYHHIPLAPDSVDCTSFVTSKGTFVSRYMQFGHTNAPATWQRYMNKILHDFIRNGEVVCYFDDIVVLSPRNGAQHAEILGRVLQRLIDYGLHAKPSKCHFGYERIKFLGHIVENGAIRVDPAKVFAVRDFPTPTNVTKLKAFLGLANYYRDFVHAFALIAKPLYELTKKNQVWVWTDERESAFKRLKLALVTAPCLRAPDEKLPFRVHTDASGDGFGAVLTQVVDGKEHPVCFFSQQLTPAQKNYSTTDLECAAVIAAVRHWEYLLMDQPFTIFTDHSALQWMPSKNSENKRLVRAASYLSQFNFEVVHVKGKDNVVADALSRNPQPNTARACYLDFITRAMHINRSRSTTSRSAALHFIPFYRRPATAVIYASVRSSRPPQPPQIITEQFVIEDLSERDTLIAEQRTDHELAPLIDYLQKNEIPLMYSAQQRITFKRDAENYFIHPEDDGLYYRDAPRHLSDFNSTRVFPRLVIPVKRRAEILALFHDSPFGGHSGITRTYRKISAYYFWPKLFHDVTEHVRVCPQCLSDKSIRRQQRQLRLSPDRPSRPFQIISMDYAQLPQCEDYTQIIIIVDLYTHYILAWPVIAKSLPTARLLHGEVFCKFGFPEIILSDRGPQFTSGVWLEFLKVCNIQVRHSSVERPQSNGAAERAVRNIKEFIVSLDTGPTPQWVTLLPSVLFAYNSAPHETTGMSPHRMLFGSELRYPFAPTTASMAEYDGNESELMHVRQLVHNRDVVYSNMTRLYADQVKKAIEARIGGPIPVYRVGDTVFLRYKHSPLGRASNALHRTYLGPYTVVARLGPTAYSIQPLGRPHAGVQNVNSARLKPAPLKSTADITVAPALLAHSLPARKTKRDAPQSTQVAQQIRLTREAKEAHAAATSQLPRLPASTLPAINVPSPHVVATPTRLALPPSDDAVPMEIVPDEVPAAASSAASSSASPSTNAPASQSAPALVRPTPPPHPNTPTHRPRPQAPSKRTPAQSRTTQAPAASQSRTAEGRNLRRRDNRPNYSAVAQEQKALLEHRSSPLHNYNLPLRP